MLIAITACGAAAACAGAGSAMPAEASATAGQPALHRGVLAPPVDEARLVAALRSDAANAWGAGGAAVPAGQLRVQVQAVTWSDGAMGCPQPGQMYTMALVPGWRVQIEHAGQQRSYHASRSGQWLLCPAGQAGVPAQGDPQAS